MRAPASTIARPSRPARRRRPGTAPISVQRPLRGRQADALRRPARSALASRSSESARCAPRLVPASAWISSTITVLDAAQRSRAPASQQQVERLGRGDQDVGRVAAKRAPLVGRRVAGADGDAAPRAARRRALGRAARCRPAARAGCARRRRPAPSAARRRARGSRALRRRARLGTSAGRGTRGTRRASCRCRWAQDQRVLARRRWPASPGPGRASARRTPREPGAGRFGEGGQGIGRGHGISKSIGLQDAIGS